MQTNCTLKLDDQQTTFIISIYFRDHLGNDLTQSAPYMLLHRYDNPVKLAHIRAKAITSIAHKLAHPGRSPSPSTAEVTIHWMLLLLVVSSRPTTSFQTVRLIERFELGTIRALENSINRRAPNLLVSCTV